MSVSDQCWCHSIMALINMKMLLPLLQIFLLTITISYAQNENLTKFRRSKTGEIAQPSRQVKRNAEDDQQSSETKDHSKGAKFFMYAHQPDKKAYEFGYKRGNDHHVIERYEKAGPKHNFKTKVRWHDAHGGHGEQYWDYNHAPKHHEHHDNHHHHGEHDHHGHGHGSHHGYGHGHGHHSEPVPSIVEAESRASLKQSDGDDYKQSKLYKRSGFEKKPTDILKKSPSKKKTIMSPPVQEEIPNEDYEEVPSAFPAVLGFDPYVPPKMVETRTRSPPAKRTEADTVVSSPAPAKNFGRRSQRPYKSTKERDVPKLAYDLDTGRVYNEKSGKWFKLVQV